MSINNPTTPTSFDAFAVGRSATNPFITTFQTRDPTSADVNWPIQKRWFNTTLNREWILLSITVVSSECAANWAEITSGSVSIEQLEGNSGGAVSPNGSGIIFVVGDTSTIDIVGDPSTNTLTASTAGTVATQYDEDSGSAIPSAGVLNINGGTGIATSGSGNTIVISIDGDVATSFHEDSGTATPSSGVLHISGGTGITTSGATNVVTITANGEEVTYTENSGTAQVSAGNLNVLGSSGINTTGSGSTITISPGTSIATTYDADTGSAVPSSNILNIHGGTGITTSGSGSTITITSTAIKFDWQTTSINVSPMVKDNGYIAISPGGNLTFALPATAGSTIGDTLIITLDGATSFEITQAAGQQIVIGASTTTLGTSGSLTSTSNGDTIELVYQASGRWNCVNYNGNITVV